MHSATYYFCDDFLFGEFYESEIEEWGLRVRARSFARIAIGGMLFQKAPYHHLLWLLWLSCGSGLVAVAAHNNRTIDIAIAIVIAIVLVVPNVPDDCPEDFVFSIEDVFFRAVGESVEVVLEGIDDFLVIRSSGGLSPFSLDR